MIGAYRFDLMGAILPDGDRSALHRELRERPFQLFYPSTESEVAAYVADPQLRDAVNVSLATGRPLLLTGEPGTGKTSAATWVAGRLGLELIRFQVKSNSRAQDLLYTFNAIDYFRASQVAAAASGPKPDMEGFVERGPFWTALAATERPTVLLIDEIDKAPRDFPNDLLFELDRMEFVCREAGNETVKCSEPGLRPIVIITSNSERRLPEPFLRRCVYHNIVLEPTAFRMILDARLEQTKAYFTVEPSFREAAETCFFKLRTIDALQKKPSINEFWQWFAIASNSQASRDIVGRAARSEVPLSMLPHLSSLLKITEDIERIA